MSKEKPTTNDYLLAGLKGGISAIPFAGGVINEFLNLTIKSPLEKRQKEWLESLYLEIEKLKEKQKEFESDKLKVNDNFISSFTRASQIAIKTHEREKIEYLRNAVINSVDSNSQSFEQTIFLNYIDILTPVHIDILKTILDKKSSLL